MLHAKSDRIESSSAAVAKPWRWPVRLARRGVAGLGLAMVAAFVLPVLAAQLPTRVSVDAPAVILAPDDPITVASPLVGSSVVEVSLREDRRGIDGEIVGRRWVPVELAPSETGGRTGIWSLAEVRTAEGAGPLTYDAQYLLRVSTRAKEWALPWPRDAVTTKEYSFSTLTTPQLHAAEGVVRLRYQRPLELHWNAPVRTLAVETVPAVPVSSWVDPVRPNVAYVDLSRAEPGAVYEVRPVGAVGANEAPLNSSPVVRVETAKAPMPLGEQATIEGGDRIVLPWDRELASFEYRITPAVASEATVSPDDRRVSFIALRNPRQGQEYAVTVTGGAGATGAPIAAGYAFTVATPDPLEVVEIAPRRNAYGVEVERPFSITFAEAIANPAAAEAAIAIEPAVPGRFEWPEPNRLEFVPRDGWPYLADIEVTVRPGPELLRGASGSYLEEPFSWTFRTRPNKLIEVDLSRQVLILYEAGRPAFTTPVATGVRYAETPTGWYLINFKLPATRMRGVNPSGTRYDIPNVPWVMSFLGDYTIHAAPWRSTFGFPQSNGCVSMSTAAAKHVYDWSPVGTPVWIHY